MKLKELYLSFLSLLFVTGLYAQSLEIKEWKLINSSEVTDTDVKISSLGYPVMQWFDAHVPVTVLNALIHEGVYPDPRIGLNNYKIPDVSDDFNRKMDLSGFTYLESGRNPWQDPYWYRTEIEVPASFKGRKIWLNLDGINYRADVWVNGSKIADRSDVVGMFRRFSFDVTDVIKPGRENCVAIKIYQVDHPGIPTPGTQLKPFGPVRGHSYDIFKDETLKISGGWDCAPVVRDRNMGIYKKVTLEATGDVLVRHPYVVTSLPDGNLSKADVNIKVNLRNTSARTLRGYLKTEISLVNEVEFPTYTKHMEGRMKPVRISKSVSLAPGESREVELSSREFQSLLIQNPHLWYPNGYGEQWLHHLKMEFVADRKVSDACEFDFGIREVKTDLHQIGNDFGRVYYVNGKRIFCRGGWIQPDILLEESEKNIYDQARLMAEANINLVGSEDMPSPSDAWLESFDKYGIMWWHVFYQCFRMMPGTETADNPSDYQLAVDCARDEILRYRNHPSVITWIGANEVLMSERLYDMTKEMVHDADSFRLYIPTTSHGWDVEELTPYLLEDLPTGTTDDGAPDYNWAPSSYYFDKVREVHLQMFRNELGSPSVPVYNSLRKFMPEIDEKGDKNSPIYPLDEVWAEHGAWDVSNYCYRSYDNAIRTMFGDPKSAKDYSDWAQYLNADSYRAMFEAANHRMWDITTGVMIWKINSCWPDVCWQLYDWYLTPNASYYFAKKAMEPVHIQLNANDSRVSVINTTDQICKNMKVTAEVVNNDMSVVWNKEVRVDVMEDSYKELFGIPFNGRYSYNYFIRLKLHNEEGELVSENLYWYYSQHMDFNWFTYMERPELEKKVDVRVEDGEYVVSVELKNNTDKLSFFNRLILLDADEEEINPVFWSDNYITLFPGEIRKVEARASVSDAGEKYPSLEIYE